MSKILNEAKELMKLWGAFRVSRVLLTANNFGVFDRLIKPQSAKEVSEKTGTDPRATEILLDAITSLGLLKKTRGSYSNTAIASKFLVKGKPYYQGDILRHIESLWQNWSGLDEVVRTGKPNRKAGNHEAFIMGMHNLAVLKAKDIMKLIGLKGVKTALDLGGGPGTYSIEMAIKGVKVTLFDRPETVAIARRVTASTKNIDFISGDFVTDDIGSGYDLIFASQILHSTSEEDCISLLKKCRAGLNKNGRMVIQEFFITKDRAHPAPGALFAVNMLVNTEAGRCYSPEEMKEWFLKAGLKNPKIKIIDETVLVWATSP